MMCGHETDGAGVPVTYCYDERHGTPCPQPCAACVDEGCDLNAPPWDHPAGCACEACDPLYQMTREGD